jgi:hypothetical protein
VAVESDSPGQSSVVLAVDRVVPSTEPRDVDSKNPLESSSHAVGLVTGAMFSGQPLKQPKRLFTPMALPLCSPPHHPLGTRPTLHVDTVRGSWEWN